MSPQERLYNAFTIYKIEQSKHAVSATPDGHLKWRVPEYTDTTAPCNQFLASGRCPVGLSCPESLSGLKVSYSINGAKSFDYVGTNPNSRTSILTLKTLRPRLHGHFTDDIFKCSFFNENVSISLDWDLTEICSNWQYSSIGSDNGLASNTRQAIIWTNADYFSDAYMRHSASMS